MYEPLYKRVKPLDIDEVVGQTHLLGSSGPLRAIVERGKVPSLLFYGPPGVGKSLVAELISKRIDANFVKLSAVSAGIPEVKKVVQEAQRLKKWGRDTVLFLDEIHRFNKAQQDFLLPYVEDGTIILMGASTENPIFALNSALLSRVMVFEFKPLSEDELIEVLKRALLKINITQTLAEEAIRYIARRAGGDARKALGMLELVLDSVSEPEIDREKVERVLGGFVSLGYDVQQKYDVVSAFIKSVRGSDPDAALYWLSVMLEAGEDPLYITRRLMILAAEDVGLSDPVALLVAVAAHEAVSHVGMPEGELILAFATVYLATTTKSNSCYEAIKRARSWVKEHPNVKVPAHLADSHSWEKRHLSDKYLYPHDFPGGFVKQRYMPFDVRFFYPKDVGRERRVKERLNELWGERYAEKKDA